VQYIHEIIVLRSPTIANFVCIAKAFPKERVRVKIRLKAKTFKSYRIKCISPKIVGNTIITSILASIVGLETRRKDLKIV